jgi:hypothetical protein
MDFGEMTSIEIAEFDSLAERLVPAVKSATVAERV